MFNKYPYTDFHELNLDWVISEVQKINESIDSLIDINTIKYADPIDWDISKQYEKNTIVINNYNTYLSKLPVPAGIPIDNTDYWLLIGNFNIPLEEVKTQIREIDARVDDVDTDIVELKEKDVHIENMIAGTWSSTITYSAGTYVTYIDSMYRCKLQNIGTVPTNTTYWELVSVGQELTKINNNPKIVCGSASFPSASSIGSQTIEVSLAQYGFTQAPTIICSFEYNQYISNYFELNLSAMADTSKFVVEGTRKATQFEWPIRWTAIGY